MRGENKYHNKKIKVDGHLFDSKKEAERYYELKLMEHAGVIRHLELQPRFELQPPFECDGIKHRKIEYVGDFAYQENGRKVVEDVKGMETDVYKLKKKLFLYQYGEQWDFREIK